jgi:ribonuclease P protein component
MSATVRRGTRAGRRYLVLHILAPEELGDQAESGCPARVGFTVNRAVGGSVVRHRVVRRLRHVVAGHLTEIPAGATVVVRALPPAATASSEELDRDLTALLARVAS